MLNIYANEIISNIDNGKKYRVLWVSENNKYTFLIDMQDKNAFPMMKNVKEITEMIIDGSLAKESLDLENLRGNGKISDKAMQMRDEAWAMIKDIVSMEPDIFISKKRGQLVREIMKKYGISKPTVYKNLRRYWQGGKIPDTLLPNYFNSGGKGKAKKPNKKMGRPAKYKELESEVIVDEKVKKYFRVALQSFYFNKKKPSLPFTYKMMIRKFYLEDEYYDNGVKKVKLKEHESIPTIHQLRYFLQTEYTEKQKLIPRIGRIKYEQNYRELLGSSTYESFGPGSRFQIDATIADVYLISEYNPDWIIGRPVVYFVVDVFSRLIVGLYVGLEGPSWIGAMMAIANTASDKQAFCSEYDMEITKDQWPCEHLPKSLLADRGEFEGYNVERLVNAFNLDPENAAPYRPDWKGIVEKYFDIFQGRVKPFLPGYVDKDFKERGSEDYRLDAKLTLKDFTKIMIAEIIFHNNHHFIKDYPRDKEMIEDNVQPIPIMLWKWGIKNRSGKLTYHSHDKIKLNLLPRDVATVTEKGIKYKKMHFLCDKAIRESWFSTARISGSWKVNIAYDPRNMSKIYLLNDNGSSFETCTLVDHEKERYGSVSAAEVTYLVGYEDLEKRKYENTEITEEINFINQVEGIVTSAIQNANEQQSKDISKSQKVSSISEHRSFEKEQLREKELFRFESHEEKMKDKVESKENEGQEYRRKSIKEILKQNTNGDQKNG